MSNEDPEGLKKYIKEISLHLKRQNWLIAVAVFILLFLVGIGLSYLYYL